MQYRNSGASEEHVIQNQFTAYLLVALRRRKRAFFPAAIATSSMNSL